ncbi:MAG: SpoIIE family protein phosphatase [Acidimicrobiales bacterium]
MATERSPAEWDLAVRQQGAVARVGQMALQLADLDELLEATLGLAAETLDVTEVVLFEVTAESASIGIRAACRGGVVAPRAFLEDIRVPTGNQSLPGFVVATGSSLGADDLLGDERFKSYAPRLDSSARSAVAAAITWGARPWGALIAYSQALRHWTEDEVRFVEAVGSTVGLAIQRSGTLDELRTSSLRLDLSLLAGGLGAWTWNLDSDQMTFTDAARQVFGMDGEGLNGTGHDFLQAVHADDRHSLLEAIDEVFASGAKQHHLFRILGDDGRTVRWIEAWGQELVDRAGRQLVGVAADVTAHHLADQEREAMLARELSARVAAEAASERLRFLSAASARLGGTLDLAGIVDALADLCVPYLADVCLVDLIDDHNGLAEQGARAVDTRSLEDVRALRQRRMELGGGGGIWSEARVATQGRTLLHHQITDADFVAAAADEEHLALFRRFGAGSAVIAPMIASGPVMGVLSLMRNRSPQAYEVADLTLIEEFATRAALAVENGRLFHSRTRVARSLQAALLPPALPHAAGLVLAARYEVADAAAEIGGDFYDVMELAPGTWGVVVGDVCGRGPDAAALTGLVRHSVRSAVVHEKRPAEVLRHTNTAVLDQIDDDRFCTAAFLCVTAPASAGQGVQVAASSAGHPRPVLVRADGDAEAIECAGTLLGVVADPALTDVVVTLRPGDAVVLYTDGVTEARREGELFDECRLLAALTELAGEPAEAMANGLHDAVCAYRDGTSDDIAIVVVQAAPCP